MMKKIAILLLSFPLVSCQPIQNQTNRSLRDSFILPQETIEKRKSFGYWAPSVAYIICMTGGIALKYDDTLGEIEEGSFDKLANGYKWRDKQELKLIESSIEKFSENTVYTISYKSGPVFMKQRIAFGSSQIHNDLSMFDKTFTQKGFKRMRGELYIDGRKIENTSACWGISLPDRFEQSDKNAELQKSSLP